MSRVYRLAIKGIRNFDDESEPPTIKFFGPLTLILGPNGTGKTTIIESLRYVLSGEFPPGSDSGKAFVHDPTLKRLTNVFIRGNVKAEIADCKGKRYIINRIIELTQTEKRVTLRSKDNTLQIVDRETKQKIPYSAKCGDINTEIMSIMGVSKAMINYVLFCHQDDANWPFETGKKLKERFDEIFETSRYNKALESIRKQVNEGKVQLKGLAGEQRGLLVIVNEVKLKQRKLKDLEERRADIKVKIDDLVKTLKPIQDKLAKIHEMEMEYSNWQIQAERKKTEHKHVKDSIRTLKENIKEIYAGSTEELIKEIASYDEILSEKNDKIIQLERELQESREKEKKIADLNAERRVKVGTLRQQMHDQEVKIARRNDILREMLPAWDLNESLRPNLTETDAKGLIKKFEARLHQREQEMEEKRAEQDRELDRLQRKVNNLRTERSMTGSQLEHNESDLVKIRAEIRSSQAKLKQSGAMEQQLNEVDSKLDRANKKVDGLNETLEIDALKRKIHETTAKEEKLDAECNRVDREIAQLREQSSIHIKLEASRSELAEKEKELQALRDKHSDTLTMLLGKKKLPEGNMKHTLNEAQDILNKRVQNLRKEIETLRDEAMKLEMSVKHKQKELEKKETEVQRDKVRISQHCEDYANYSEVVLLQSKKIKVLEDKRAKYAYQEAAYKDHIITLSESDPCCPLCDRGFRSPEDATELAKKLRKSISGHPELLKNHEKELAAQRKKYDELLQLQPIVDKIENFEKREINAMRQDIAEATKSLSDLREKVKRLQDSVAEPEKKLSVCKDMVGDMALWDRYSDEVEIINVNVIELQDQLQNAGLKTDKTLQEVETDYNELQQMLKKTRNDVKTLQATLNSRSEELRRATESRTKLLEEQLRIHQEMQDIKQAKEALDGLRVKEKTVNETIQKLNERLAGFENELDGAEKNLERVKQKNRLEQESNRKAIREDSKDLDKLNSIHAEVSALLSRNIAEKLKTMEAQLETGTRMAEKYKTERADRESQVAKMNETIRFHDTAKRDLSDNLSLRRKETEIETVKAAFQELREKLVNADYANITKVRKELCERRDLTEREMNKAKGQDEELEAGAVELTLEMSHDDYRFASRNYREKCAELTTCRKAIEDLHAYSRVLDAAMIEFHEERMSTVNKIMKRLWDLVYTGTDTTSIQIRTEATTADFDKRRQFNYRLIQVKHGVEMDMKGRCSAGQKVLASIVLRLALAETFCEKCGVLALDEPTTNLDEENSRSLANALHKYISLRKTQRNFQLIVITHDEHFIPHLGQLSSTNSYYELFRHPNGLSGIKSVSMDKLSGRNEGHSSEDDGDGIETKRDHQQRGVKRDRDRFAATTARADVSAKCARKKYRFD